MPLPPTTTELPNGWCCYILLCNDGSFYTGISDNLSQRIQDHRNGKGGVYTRENKPLALVWFEACSDEGRARRREKQIKAWGHAKKEKLSTGQPPFLFGKPVKVSLG